MRRIAATLVLLGACGSSPLTGPAGEGGRRPPGPCRLELSARDVPGDFVPLTGTTEVAVIAGFQGFIYALVRVRVLDSDPRVADVRIESTLHALGASAQQQTREPLTARDGGMASEDIMVFFNSIPYADLVGGRMHLRVDIGSRECACGADAEVVLQPGEETP